MLFLHSHHKWGGIILCGKWYSKFSSNLHVLRLFYLNYTRYDRKVMIQNCLLHKDLQIWIAKFFHKMYIFLFNLKYWKSKIQFFNHNMWNTKEKWGCKIVCINKVYKFCLTQFLTKYKFIVPDGNPGKSEVIRGNSE